MSLSKLLIENGPKAIAMDLTLAGVSVISGIAAAQAGRLLASPVSAAAAVAGAVFIWKSTQIKMVDYTVLLYTPGA